MIKGTKKNSFRADIFSFMSLYLFILIFFVILINLTSSIKIEDSVRKFLIEIHKIAKHTNSEFKELDISNIYATKKQDPNFSVTFIKNQDLSKKFTWEEIFDSNENFNENFNNHILATKQYITDNDPEKNKLLFVIPSENSDNLLYNKVSKLIKFMNMNYSNFYYEIKLDNNDSSNSIFIRVSPR